MALRKRMKQLAKRAEGLAAAIRSETKGAKTSSASQALGVLSFLDEAAALLHRARSLMEGRTPEDEPVGGEEEAVLRAVNVDAAVRYVAAAESFHVTEAEAQETYVSLAVKLAELRGKILKLRHGVDRGWPEAMFEGTVPPTLAFELFGAADTLVEEYLDPAIDTARFAAEVTAEEIRSEWEDRRRVRNAQTPAELPGDPAAADSEEP